MTLHNTYDYEGFVAAGRDAYRSTITDDITGYARSTLQEKHPRFALCR
jgi:hypothetical protein